MARYLYEQSKVKPVDSAVREGKRGTGHRLRYLCGFCGARFRSRRQRTDHTKLCKE